MNQLQLYDKLDLEKEGEYFSTSGIKFLYSIIVILDILLFNLYIVDNLMIKCLIMRGKTKKNKFFEEFWKTKFFIFCHR